MSHHDHFPKAFRARSCNRLRGLAWAALAVLLTLASVPALAQYEYRRSITVDRTKVTNPATLPVAFDNVSSAITADAGASSLSWNHTVGSGNDKIAIVAVSSAQAAITADPGSSLGGGGVSNLTLSHTVGAGNNKALIVSVCIRANTTVSTVTYGGTPLSPIGAVDNTGNVRVEMWGLLGVSPQTADVVVTMSALANFIVGAVSFSNVGTIPAARFVSAVNTNTSPTVTVASAAGEVVVDALANLVGAGTTTATIGPGQTANWSSIVIPGQVRGSGSREAGAPSVTMSWTLAVSRAWAIGAVPLTPAGSTITQVMFGANDITTNVVGTVSNTGNCAVSMYYLLNPTAGANTVSVTQSASTRFVAGAFSLFNVDQTTPLGTFASATGSGQGTWAAGVDVPSASGEIVVGVLAKRYNYTAWPEQSTQQADRWTLSTGLNTSEDILGIGTLRGGEASARAYWLLSGGATWQEWAVGGVPVKPTTAAPPQITTLSNYPMLVSLTDPSLKTVANGGHVWNANGWDIVFRASDGVTQLDHEIERYDSATGQVVAWVRLPSVNGAGAGSDTQVYIYYGYKGISGPTQNKTAVWDANYMEVWHLGETSGNATDSTSNGYTATVQANPGTPTHPAAKIDGGFRFGGDSWLLTNDGQFNVANAPFTIEGWFQIESGPPTWVGIATKNRDVTCTDNPPYCDWAGVWIGGSSELNYAWDWHNQANMGGGPALSTGVWYHGTIVFDGGMRTGYRNGVRDTVVTEPNPSPGVYASLTMPTRMNSDMTGGANMVGTIDEVRISTVARTPGWVLTSYTNMNNPGNIGAPGFYTVGNADFLRFNYRRLITILDTMTPGTCSSNLTSFPLLVSITNDANLKTVANGGHVQNANGYDIVFRAMDDVTQLDHEIERYDGVNGTLVAWVRIPALLYNAATTIYMYYGNPGVPSSTENKTGVWSNGYRAVWHLRESPTGAAGEIKDSTSNANNGTTVGSMDSSDQVLGKVDGSLDFDGLDDLVDFGNPGSLQLTGAMTASTWVWVDAFGTFPAVNTRFVTKSGDEPQRGWELNLENSDSKAYFIISADGTSAGQSRVASTANVPTGQWVQYVGVYEPSTAVRIYVNGLLDNSNTTSIPASQYNAANNVHMAERTLCSNCYLDGKLDEVRISNVARDACWIGTGYNNESTPGTYVTVDPEQAVSAFAFRRAITIPDAMTPAGCSSNLTNFPVPVSITNASLRSASNGGNVQSVNGYDIVFRAADGITVLDHEIERYIATTGELVAWVRIPTLVYNAATTIYMYYGNPAITSATANPTGVWNTSYGWRGVWHMSEATSATRNDSTINANNLTQTGSVPLGTGQIAGAASFNGTTQFLSRADSGAGSSLDITGPLTVEAWVSMAATQADTSSYILDKWRGTCGATTNPPYYLRNNNTAPPYRETLQLAHTCGPTTCTAPDCVTGGGTASMSASTFYHIVGVYDGSNMSVYRNASVVAGPTAFTLGPYDSDGIFYVAVREGTQQFFSGLIDEVRVSATSRDACWVGTEYNSMATPATVSVEAANAPTLVEMVSLDATEYPGRGVLVSWRTGFEVDNLGFHVYRDQGGQRIRVTPSLIAGSALFAGAGTPLTAGRSYAWWDRSPVSGASYWLEEWDLSGEKRWHGPVQMQPAVWQAQGLSAVASPLLAGLGQPASPSSPQGVRRKLRQVVPPGEDRLAVQWGLASRPAVKLLVSEAGWYRVGQEELVRAGLDPAVDPSRLQLFADGLQVPILVNVRQQGVFASGDGIEFYGEGLNTPSTAVRVYWLTVGLGEGLRIPEASGGGRWAPGPASFPYEVERADRTLYFPGLLNGDEENFFGAVVTGTPVAQTVRVQHVDQGGPGELVVRLQGGTVGTHRVGVELNGTRVGTVVWEGMAAGELSVPVGGHMILEGDNRVVLAAEGGEGDVSAVESIRVRYQHTWQADGEGLKFSLGGFQEVTINGFASAQVKVLDVTDPGVVQALPVEVVTEGEGYRATVGVPEPGTRTLVAVGTGAVRHPVGVLPNRPSAWHAASPGADLLIIGHRSLLPALEPLRALRESQGLAVAVVDVESVYDEFSFGARSPQAIKDFLACAITTWSRPPRYLLLVGDASFDPRNYLGYGFLDLVPTKLVDTKYLETASDDWFADFDGDGIADIPVGRLPVQTSWEATTVVGKIVAYEGSSASPRVLLVADANDKGNDFEGLSGQVKAVLPSSVTVTELFRGQLWDAATSTLTSQLNLGQTLVNYIGHGSNEVWRGNLLTTDAALQLKHDRLPLWLPMTCLNGYFQAPYGDSLAEALLKAPSGGAVAVWASSGLTESGDQLPVDEALVRLLFSGTSTTLGDATLAAKAAAKDLDVRTTWILFGDPTTRLRP